MTKSLKKLVAIVSAFAIIALMVVPMGCNSGGDVINIGCIIPQSGTNAGHNDDSMYGLQMLVKDINDGTNPLAEEGGGLKVGDKVYRLNLIVKDGGLTADSSVTAVNSLYYDSDVFMCWGPVGSSGTLAAFDITETEGFIFWGISTAEACMKTLDDPVNFFFRCGPPASVKVPAVYNLVSDYSAENELDLDKIAMVSWEDDAGHEAREFAEEWCDDNDVDFYFAGYFAHDNTMWSQMANDIIAQDPDAIDIGPAYSRDTAMILKELYNKGWDSTKPVFRSVGSVKLNDLMDLLVGVEDAAQGFMMTTAPQDHWPTLDELDVEITERVETLVERSYDEYPDSKDPRSAYGNVAAYMELEMALKAMKEVGSAENTYGNVLAIADQMTTYSLESCAGTLQLGGLESYGAKHQLDIPTWLGVINKVDDTWRLDYAGFGIQRMP